MSAPSANTEGAKPQSENIEEVANQVSNEVNTEPTKSRLSRREELEIWQAQKLAKRAKATAPKTPAAPHRSERFSIVPSTIHQKCKEHATAAPSAASSSSATSGVPKPAITPLFQQHAAQASKLLHAHTPVKAPAAVPQTAPKPVTSLKRTSVASEVPTMPALMTPQTKPRGPNIAAKSSSAAPVQMAPLAATPSRTSAQSSGKPIAAKATVAIAEVEKKNDQPTQIIAKDTPIAAKPQETQKKSNITDSQVKLILGSMTWKGMVDAWAIKLLEGAIHRRCISILKIECPREGDDVNQIMDKYIRGKEAFEALESSYQNMNALLTNQKKHGMQLPKKPFKTAYFYLYRAIFEEYHEQIPEATTFFEKAITEGVEPLNHVMSAFKHFCGRIRELTQQQMTTRPSLAVGVRRMQMEQDYDSSAAKEDAKALADLLEEDEDDDFGMGAEMDADEQVEEIVEENFAEEPQNEVPVEDNAMEVEEYDQEEQLSQASDEFESLEMEQDDFRENIEEAVAEPSNTDAQLPLREKMADTAAKRVRVPETPVEAVVQAPEKPALVSGRTPAKLQALSRTPLGKARRIRLYDEEDDEEEARTQGGKSSSKPQQLDTFSVVYEATKPSKRTRMVIPDSDKVVTPMRRSNRIAQPLRADQSTTASDLLPVANWSYQPNDALFTSGKMEAIKAPTTPAKNRTTLSMASPAVYSAASALHAKQTDSTPHRKPIAPQHLVPRSAAIEKLAQINASAKTPSKMGPPRRVPVSFDDDLDDENEVEQIQDIQSDETPDVDEIAKSLKSMDIPSSAAAASSVASSSMLSASPSMEVSEDLSDIEEALTKEKNTVKSTLSGSASSSLSLSLDFIGSAGTTSASSSFYSARATFDTEDDEDDLVSLCDVEVDPVISGKEIAQKQEDGDNDGEEKQETAAPVEPQERVSKRSSARRSIIPASSTVTSIAPTSNKKPALRKRIVIPTDSEEQSEESVPVVAKEKTGRFLLQQTKSKNSPASRKKIDTRQEEQEASKSSDEDQATPPMETGSTSQPASLYLSMRKAAYSGTYGSGYVVTPSKSAPGSESHLDQDLTPARRSRRIAKNSQ